MENILRWPSEKQRESMILGIQDPLEPRITVDRNCRECGAPTTFNHHEDCWTGELERKLYEAREKSDGWYSSFLFEKVL